MKKLLLFFVLCLFSVLTFAQIAPPLNMTLIDQWDADTLPTAGSREYNDCWGWVDCSGNEYAIMGSAAFIHFFNVTQPGDIEELARFEGGQVTTWRDMKTYRDRAYAVSDNTSEGLMIFDLSNIQDTIIKTYHSSEFFGRAHNIFIDEEHGRLYAVGTNTTSQGIIIFDIDTDPDNPILLGDPILPGGGYIHDIYVKNNIGYASHGYNGLYIWDFSDAANPVYLADITTNGYNHSSWASDDGTYLIFAEEVPLGLPLGIVDITDQSMGSITLTNTFKFPLLAPAHTNNVPHNPFLRGDYAIVSHYHDGLQIFDLSDHQNPQQVAYYDSHDNSSYSGYSGNWGVYPFLPSGNLIVSDINEGLLILSADSITLEPVVPTLFPEADLIDQTPQPFCDSEEGSLLIDESADSFVWFKDDVELSIDSNIIVLNESGNYYCRVSNKHCSINSDTIEITVNPQPDLSGFMVDPVSFCEGETSLVQAPSGFDNYIWLQDGNVVQQGDTLLTVTEAGTYNLTVSLGPCSTMSEDILISTNPLPDASITFDGDPIIVNDSTLIICEGELVQLLANAVAGSVYSWFQDGNQLSINSPEIQLTSGGIYEVEVTSEQGCSKRSNSITVILSAGLTPEITFDGSILSEIDGASSYQWYLNGELIEGATNQNYAPTENGDYTCVAFNSDGCAFESNTINVVLSSIFSIESLESFEIFPNPNNGQFSIKLLFEIATDVEINLEHIDGRNVQNWKRNDVQELVLPVDLATFPAGFYLVKISTEDGQAIQKVIKN